MFARNLLKRSALVARQMRRGGHERTTDSAPIGSNLPFNIHASSSMISLGVWTFFIAGIGAPFAIIEYHKYKQG